MHLSEVNAQLYQLAMPVGHCTVSGMNTSWHDPRMRTASVSRSKIIGIDTTSDALSYSNSSIIPTSTNMAMLRMCESQLLKSQVLVQGLGQICNQVLRVFEAHRKPH
jgi:hypothetical protein